jgi:hypothetical protein
MSTLWFALVSIAGLSLLVRIALDVRRLVADRLAAASRDDGYTPLHPVFTEREVREAYGLALEDSARRAVEESRLYNDAQFKREADGHRISPEISERMLEVSRHLVWAESAWFAHSVLMDANISVTTGAATRDAALEAAETKLALRPSALRGDEYRLRDQWKARLEQPNAPATDPAPFPYSTPWTEHGKRRYS